MPAELEVSKEHDQYGTPTGRYMCEVYDAEPGGPINGDYADSVEQALTTGRSVRVMMETNGLYCDECESYDQIGIDACQGCCRRR